MTAYATRAAGTTGTMREGQPVLIDVRREALHHVRPAKRGARLSSMKNLPLSWVSLCEAEGTLLLYASLEMEQLPLCGQCEKLSRHRVGTRPSKLAA